MNNEKTSQRNILNKNPYERKVLKMIFLFAALPVILIFFLFWGLFSDLIYTYIHTDLSQHFMDRVLIFSALILFYYILFARFVFSFVHRTFGSYERILQELDNIISNKEKKPLHLRKNDFGQGMILRINKLIQEMPGKS